MGVNNEFCFLFVWFLFFLHLKFQRLAFLIQKSCSLLFFFFFFLIIGAVLFLAEMPTQHIDRLHFSLCGNMTLPLAFFILKNITLCSVFQKNKQTEMACVKLTRKQLCKEQQCA